MKAVLPSPRSVISTVQEPSAIVVVGPRVPRAPSNTSMVRPSYPEVPDISVISYSVFLLLER